ncbi:SCO family protein [Guyparkeria halophila]|uniref:SCO family protein n=1 Tax=Guyparkeria halophila TaxID=47960 RepID=A0ABZ0YV96_9GAMM|nr:SCO family protein [Guyparkeria halophila]WQH15678.1 SCO family protein [Guyparkeria halophila]
MSRFKSLLILGLLPLMLLGCSEEPPGGWHGHDITGVMPDLEFDLTNHNSEPVTAEKYRGKITMMFFGYTSCPHVCPVALRKLAAATRDLGQQADQVEILFVAVDPKRDKKVLDEYVSDFTPELVGLTGTQEQLKEVAKRYRVAFSYEEPQDDGFYIVNHSGAVFVFDQQGKVRLLIDEQSKTANITEDLRHLLEQSSS